MWPLAVSWTQQPQLHPLPDSISRTFIQTPSGPLELLLTHPSSPKANANPILLIHGGFGSASVWIPWLTYLSSHGYHAYALSLRGHGASWTPGFLSMWMFTSKYTLAPDLVAGIKHVESLHPSQRVILGGHSSGGGLSQLVLSDPRFDVKVAGLALVAAIPPFGSMGVYWNWFKLDPWFMVRSWVHMQHPRSPLSSTQLVWGAFFGNEMDEDGVREFERWMPKYESLNWAIGMLRAFVDPTKVIGNIVGWEESDGKGGRVAVIAGGVDKLMRLDIMERVAETYRGVVREMVGKKKVEMGTDGDEGLREVEKGVLEERREGVTLVVVEEAGHHLQNDAQREKGAEAFRRWVDGL
jgi:pimeloyl-ACP methyl ester carboxylesterase